MGGWRRLSGRLFALVMASSNRWIEAIDLAFDGSVVATGSFLGSPGQSVSGSGLGVERIGVAALAAYGGGLWVADFGGGQRLASSVTDGHARPGYCARMATRSGILIIWAVIGTLAVLGAVAIGLLIALILD